MKTQRLVMHAAIAAVLVSTCLAAEPATKPAPPKPAVTKLPKRVTPPPAVSARNGQLNYVPDARGNRVPDFSVAGYAGGDKPIPTVPAKLRIEANTEDNTAAIQAAIDQVSKLPLDENGFRGAVLLPPGEIKVGGPIVIRASGVVLRGSGMNDGGTTLVATGHDRRTVIRIDGPARPQPADGHTIFDAYVPVGSKQITIANARDFKAGDTVLVRRPSTPDWIISLGMDDLGGDRHGPNWNPGSRDVIFERTVSKIDGNTLTLDAPLTIALDQDFGGGTVATADWADRVRNCGVENLRIVADIDSTKPKDENHAWFGVGIDNAADCWVRQVTFKHLAGSAVAVWDNARRVTVEDCKSLEPVGEIGGWRRYSFFTVGQQVLMQRLYSENGCHDFAVGFLAAGPNAFVQCESKNSLGESGPIDSAACGTLFDRVRIDGQPLSLRNRTYRGQGSGWASFNGVIWNSSAPLIDVQAPPGAQNWSFGATGEFSGDGAYSGSNDDVNPDSLFYAQLAERIGKNEAEQRAQLVLPPVQGSRSAKIEDTAEIIEVSNKPRVDMAAWADQAAKRNPIPAKNDGVPRAKNPAAGPDELAAPNFTIRNGWLTLDSRVLTGDLMGVPWWSGSVRGDDYKKAGPALTRFVPGRIGTGLTDDIPTVVQQMKAKGQVGIVQHPPLWYERRRDDHTRVQRIDGDVVAPFYDVPWARTGEGRAYDGLSKWDVTKTNRWYFDRLRQFADLGARDGLVLFNGLYQQHNVLEAGAHYADAPWRPANNVNKINIPEPVFYAGDKLIYVAEQFYDVTDPGRAAAHRAYMRNVLNEFAEQPNVIHFLSAEYTGPLAFTQFWLDTVAEWSRETGKKPLIALNAPKDVTDAILQDPKRSAVVSMIYSGYDQGDAGFWYQSDGKLYAPEGGKNLSPRQWIRLLRPKGATFDGVYKMVSEYRTKYPDKAFVYTGDSKLAWAVLLGGGSLAPLPATTDAELLKALPSMRPIDGGLSDGKDNGLVYGEYKDLAGTAANRIREIDLATGRLIQDPKPGNGRRLFWVNRVH